MLKWPKIQFKLLILSLAITTLGALLVVWGYSSATVSTDAKVTVTESKDALVAVDIEPLEIVQCDSGAFICGWITNNLPGCIWDLRLSGGFEVASTYLDSGNSTPVLLNLTSTDTNEVGYTIYQGRVLALWDGGEAEVGFEVPVQVIEQLTLESVLLEDSIDSENYSNSSDSGDGSGYPQVNPGSDSYEDEQTNGSSNDGNGVQGVSETSDNNGTVSDAGGNSTLSVNNNNDPSLNSNDSNNDGAEQTSETSGGGEGATQAGTADSGSNTENNDGVDGY